MTKPHRPRTKLERQAAEVVRQARRNLSAEIRTARQDAGLSLHRLAGAAGISATTIGAIERESAEPSLQVLARVASALGMSLSIRLYPGTGPLIRDHIQPVMLGALLGILHQRWRRRPEVAVYKPVRGVIDLVLEERMDRLIVACEAQSDLRRLEQQVRWSRAKADALRETLGPEALRGDAAERVVGRLLLLRSTARTRAIVAEYAQFMAAAYPARTSDAYAALVGEAPWRADALVWCRVERGEAVVLDRPPRGITVGR
jgi:transcriptional regulator with XRE-family HTH domain